ncbi:PAS domain-containing protein, partial [Acinetobacter baumannii]
NPKRAHIRQQYILQRMMEVGFITKAQYEKAAKEELQRSRETLQTVTDALPALVSFVDTDERFRFLNAAYEKAYGRPAATMLGQTVREVVGEDGYRILR